MLNTSDYSKYKLEKCMLVTLSGSEDSFFPADMNMEHKIWDAKVSLYLYIQCQPLHLLQTLTKTGGPHLAWETLEKWTPAIPVLRAIMDLVETSVNPYRCYKAHTAPKHQKDVDGWAARLTEDWVFHRTPGCHLSEESTPKDVLSQGSDVVAVKACLMRWAPKRDIEYLTEQTYNITIEEADFSMGD
jgi:hypothetical protein